MKLCKDCKWYCEFKQQPTLSVCEHPKRKYVFCGSHRNVPFLIDFVFSACGKRGRWFEKKEG